MDRRPNVPSRGDRARRTLARALLFGVGGALVACATVVGLDDLVIGECKGGVCAPDAATEDRFVDPDTGAIPVEDSGVPCRGTQPPDAIRVGSPGNTFCIDTTEVTNAQYEAFLEAGVPVESQPPECAWNQSFAPDPPSGGPSQPVVNVDWCDALAYCTWAGKYLCGRVEDGRKVGPVTPETSSDHHTNQWLNACSAAARRRYPYGGVYDPARCNTALLDAGGPLDVGTAPGCEGGYAGLVDMIGNVWEWYDGPCIAGAGLEAEGEDAGPYSERCWLKGISYSNHDPNYDCDFNHEGIRRDGRLATLGFRCCSD